jgi:hypothetical protein
VLDPFDSAYDATPACLSQLEKGVDCASHGRATIGSLRMRGRNFAARGTGATLQMTVLL